MGETAGVTQDVGSDPTVGLPDFCTLFGQEIQCSQYEGDAGDAWMMNHIAHDIVDDIIIDELGEISWEESESESNNQHLESGSESENDGESKTS